MVFSFGASFDGGFSDNTLPLGMTYLDEDKLGYLRS